MIAHRLSTVRNADKILVLGRGQVVEEGTWAQLVQAGGPFAGMWEAQTRAAAPRRPSEAMPLADEAPVCPLA
jgi:ATP-binding cassette subfamily B protein